MVGHEQSASGHSRMSTRSWMQPRILYLTVYNLLFAALWASVGIVAINHISKGKFVLFEVVEPRARWVQTLTLIEVIHAAVGKSTFKGSTAQYLVIQALSSHQLAPLLYRFLRVLSRSGWSGTVSLKARLHLTHFWFWFLLGRSQIVSGIYTLLWISMGRHPMLLSGWGESSLKLPVKWADKLRYTMFYPLYPIGIGAEWWLMYKSIDSAGKINSAFPPIFYFLLALYVPGRWSAGKRHWPSWHKI